MVKPSLPDALALPRISDPRGNLTFVEANSQVPFDIRRVYFTYDVPGGESRGGHAHRVCKELVIAASGSFDIVLDNGQARKTVPLRRAYFGVLIPAMVWRELDNFSSGSVCLVLASDQFDESDYIRDYGDFLKLVASR